MSTTTTSERSALRNPVKPEAPAVRAGAHDAMSKLTAEDRAGLSSLRAKRRHRELLALLRVLNRTDGAAGPDDAIPSREERDRLCGPILAELKRVARRAPARGPRAATPTEPPPPPSGPRCLREGHPGHIGGCVIEDPDYQPPPPPAREPGPGIPPALTAYVVATEGVFTVTNPDAVRRQRVLDLARVVLDYPERDRGQIVAALFYRFLMRGR